jgi:hypothetical protein
LAKATSRKLYQLGALNATDELPLR